MGIQVFTQMIDPLLGADDSSFWVPCLSGRSVHHDPVETDAILITHINAIDFYGNGEQALRNKRAYCIGPRTMRRLQERGYRNTFYLGDKATDAGVPTKEIITWLHGDSYARDFSSDANIVPMQVYALAVDLGAVRRIPSLSPDRIWVFSPKVLGAIESNIHTKWINLMCTDSCNPSVTSWKSIDRFYPS